MAPDKLTLVCARALNIKAERLSEVSGPGTVLEWDSLGTMTILAAIHEEFGVRLPLSVAARIISISDLRTALHAKGVDGI